MNLLNSKNYSKEIVIDNFQNKVVNICDINNCTNINLSIDVMNDSTLTLNINSISSNYTQKNINIFLNHKGSNSKSFVNFFGASLDESSISIKMSSKTEGLFNISIDQNIRGLLLSENSSIKGEPILIVSKKDAKVNHALSIGPISKEIIFYLKTKNLTKKEIIQAIIESYFINMINIANISEKKIIESKIKEIINGNK